MNAQRFVVLAPHVGAEPCDVETYDAHEAAAIAFAHDFDVSVLSLRTVYRYLVREPDGTVRAFALRREPQDIVRESQLEPTTAERAALAGAR